MEKVTNASGDVQWNDYLFAGARLIGQHYTNIASGVTTTKINYFVSDSLGSVAVITDGAGAVAQRLAYDPWGKRTLGSSAQTTRGYTGHEMLDSFGLINMNGRMQDPALARFLSADPIIQDTEDGQSLNAYAYVRNNPMRYTDPSGYVLDFGSYPISGSGRIILRVDRIYDSFDLRLGRDLSGVRGGGSGGRDILERDDNGTDRPSQPTAPDPNQPPPSNATPPLIDNPTEQPIVVAPPLPTAPPSVPPIVIAPPLPSRALSPSLINFGGSPVDSVGTTVANSEDEITVTGRKKTDQDEIGDNGKFISIAGRPNDTANENENKQKVPRNAQCTAATYDCLEKSKIPALQGGICRAWGSICDGLVSSTPPGVTRVITFPDGGKVIVHGQNGSEYRPYPGDLRNR